MMAYLAQLGRQSDAADPHTGYAAVGIDDETDPFSPLELVKSVAAAPTCWRFEFSLPEYVLSEQRHQIPDRSPFPLEVDVELAVELAPFGITVNMISPGWIPVERHANDPPEQMAGYLATVPAGRWGIPDDLAGIVVLLASDAGSFISGQNICVNGGLTVAYAALQKTLAGKARTTIDGFTPEQRFFLGYANVWCQNSTEASARQRAQTDPHSSGRFRTIGAVSNSAEFAQAFGCKAPSPMIRETACRVW